MSSHPPVLVADNLTVSHDTVPILHVPHLEVASAEIVAIVGRSGCGKTTLLACISGQVRPLTGQINIRSEDETGSNGAPRSVSRTLQNFPLLHWLTVKENLALAASIKNVRGSDLEMLLRKFSADELADRYPSTLSGGERCRASLSQALLGNPNILLLDEPFTGLDSMVKRTVAASLFQIARERKAGIIFVTHDLNDALEFSDRVMVLGGRKPAKVVGEFSSKQPDAMSRVVDLLEAA